MKIAVLGGTGRIGSRVVRRLAADGYDVGAHAASTGVDIVTGDRLAAALREVDVVVNLTNARTFDDTSPAFFRSSMDTLLATADAAGVGHIVVLSIVGAEKVPGFAHYRGKVLRESRLRAGPVPFSIVRSTQFDDFLAELVLRPTAGGSVRLPATLVQPIAPDDVARAVADVAVGPPLNGIRNIAGPERFTLDQIGRLVLDAHRDGGAVVVDPTAGIYAAMHGDVLVPGPDDDALVASTTFGEWLASTA